MVSLYIFILYLISYIFLYFILFFLDGNNFNQNGYHAQYHNINQQQHQIPHHPQVHLQNIPHQQPLHHVSNQYFPNPNGFPINQQQIGQYNAYPNSTPYSTNSLGHQIHHNPNYTPINQYAQAPGAPYHIPNNYPQNFNNNNMVYQNIPPQNFHQPNTQTFQYPRPLQPNVMGRQINDLILNALSDKKDLGNTGSISSNSNSNILSIYQHNLPFDVKLLFDTIEMNISKMDCVNLATLLFHTSKKKFPLPPKYIKMVANRFAELNEDLKSREASNSLYGLRCLSSDIPEVRYLISVLNKKLAANKLPFISQAVGNALYGLHLMSSESEEIRELLVILANKVSTCKELLQAQNIGNALYGLKNMNSDISEVRLLISKLTPLIQKSKEPLNGQALGNSLYGLQNMSAKEVEVRELLQVLAVKITKTWDYIKAQEIGNALYGLKRMNSDVTEVRNLLMALIPKIRTSPECLDAQAIGNSFYGLQNMKSDSPEVRSLLDVLAEKVRNSNPELDGQAMGNSLYGLQGMSSHYREVREVILALNEKIRYSNFDFNAQEVGNALYGLQNMCSNYREVLLLLLTLTDKIEFSKQVLTNQEISNAVYGLQNMTSETYEPRILLYSFLNKFSKSFSSSASVASGLSPSILNSNFSLDSQGISNFLYGLQNFSSECLVTRMLLSCLKQKIEEFPKTILNPHHLSYIFYGFQNMSNIQSSEVSELLVNLYSKIIYNKNEMTAKQISSSIFGLQNMSNTSPYKDLIGKSISNINNYGEIEDAMYKLISFFHYKTLETSDNWTLQQFSLVLFGLQGFSNSFNTFSMKNCEYYYPYSNTNTNINATSTLSNDISSSNENVSPVTSHDSIFLSRSGSMLTNNLMANSPPPTPITFPTPTDSNSMLDIVNVFIKTIFDKLCSSYNLYFPQASQSTSNSQLPYNLLQLPNIDFDFSLLVNCFYGFQRLSSESNYIKEVLISLSSIMLSNWDNYMPVSPNPQTFIKHQQSTNITSNSLPNNNSYFLNNNFNITFSVISNILFGLQNVEILPNNLKELQEEKNNESINHILLVNYYSNILKLFLTLGKSSNILIENFEFYLTNSNSNHVSGSNSIQGNNSHPSETVGSLPYCHRTYSDLLLLYQTATIVFHAHKDLVVILDPVTYFSNSKGTYELNSSEISSFTLVFDEIVKVWSQFLTKAFQIISTYESTFYTPRPITVSELNACTILKILVNESDFQNELFNQNQDGFQPVENNYELVSLGKLFNGFELIISMTRPHPLSISEIKKYSTEVSENDQEVTEIECVLVDLLGSSSSFPSASLYNQLKYHYLRNMHKYPYHYSQVGSKNNSNISPYFLGKVEIITLPSLIFAQLDYNSLIKKNSSTNLASSNSVQNIIKVFPDYSLTVFNNFMSATNDVFVKLQSNEVFKNLLKNDPNFLKPKKVSGSPYFIPKNDGWMYYDDEISRIDITLLRHQQLYPHQHNHQSIKKFNPYFKHTNLLQFNSRSSSSNQSPNSKYTTFLQQAFTHPHFDHPNILLPFMRGRSVCPYKRRVLLTELGWIGDWPVLSSSATFNASSSNALTTSHHSSLHPPINQLYQQFLNHHHYFSFNTQYLRSSSSFFRNSSSIHSNSLNPGSSNNSRFSLMPDVINRTDSQIINTLPTTPTLLQSFSNDLLQRSSVNSNITLQPDIYQNMVRLDDQDENFLNKTNSSASYSSNLTSNSINRNSSSGSKYILNPSSNYNLFQSSSVSQSLDEDFSKCLNLNIPSQLGSSFSMSQDVSDDYSKSSSSISTLDALQGSQSTTPVSSHLKTPPGFPPFPPSNSPSSSNSNVSNNFFLSNRGHARTPPTQSNMIQIPYMNSNFKETLHSGSSVSFSVDSNHSDNSFYSYNNISNNNSTNSISNSPNSTSSLSLNPSYNMPSNYHSFQQ